MARDASDAVDVAVRVIVLSGNMEKVNAVRGAFGAHLEAIGVRLGGEVSFAVDSLPSSSSIPHGQPWGLQHTYEGALARIHNSAQRTRIHTGSPGPRKEHDSLVFLVSVRRYRHPRCAPASPMRACLRACLRVCLRSCLPTFWPAACMPVPTQLPTHTS